MKDRQRKCMNVHVKRCIKLSLALILFFLSQGYAHKSHGKKVVVEEEKQSFFKKLTCSIAQASRELSNNIGHCVSDLTDSVKVLSGHMRAKVAACSDTLKYYNIISRYDNPLETRPVVTAMFKGERTVKGQNCLFLCPGISMKQLAINVSQTPLFNYSTPSELVREKHSAAIESAQNIVTASAADNTVDLSKRIDEIYTFIDVKMSSTVDLITDKIATVFLSLDKKIKNLEVASDLGERINQLDGGMKKMFKAVNDRINSLKTIKGTNKVSSHVKKLDDELRSAVASLNKRLDSVANKKGTDGHEVWDEVQSLNSYMEKIYLTLDKKIEMVKTHATAQINKVVTWSEINGLNSKVDMMSDALNTKMKVLRSEIEQSTKEESRTLAHSIEKISQSLEQNVNHIKSEVNLLAQQTSQVAQAEKNVVDQIQSVNTRVVELSKDLSELSKSPKTQEVLVGLQERVDTLNNQVSHVKKEILTQTEEQTNALWNEIDGMNNQFKVAQACIDEKIDTKIKRIDTEVSVQIARVSGDLNTLQSQVNREIVNLKDESDRLKNATLPHLIDLKKSELLTVQKAPVPQNADQITINKQVYDAKIKEEVQKQLSSLRENSLKVKHVRKKQRLQKLLDYVLEKEDE